MARRKATKQKQPPPPPKPHFEVTPERLMQAANDTSLVAATIDKAGERALLTRRFRDSPIDRMKARGHITSAQHAAAEWYSDRYADAGIGGRVVANYAGVGGGGEATYGMATTHRQAVARAKWREGRSHLPVQMLKLVDDVVLHHLMPALQDGRQRARYGAAIGKALQPLAEWLGLHDHT